MVSALPPRIINTQLITTSAPKHYLLDSNSAIREAR